MFVEHRGHAVFDTVKLVEGHLYQLEAHLNRLLESAEKAGLQPPKSVDQMYRTILETAAASCVATGALCPANPVNRTQPGDYNLRRVLHLCSLEYTI